MMPKVTYEKQVKIENFDSRLDSIFEKFGIDCELGDIRKKQIINHYYRNDILLCLEGYVNLIGERIDIGEHKRKIYRDMLLHIHSPLLIDIDTLHLVHHQYFGEKYWREWDIEDIFRAYDMLIGENPQWVDYYTRKELYKNPQDCKNYHVLDMINDLWYRERIYGYEPMVFENIDLLDCWDFNKKVPIKINPNKIEYCI